MGSCLSAKVNGSNSNSTANTTTTTTTTAGITTTTTTITTKKQRKEPTKSVANTTASAKNDASHQKQNNNVRKSETEGPKQRNNNMPRIKLRDKTSSKRQSSVPCGKRTDFGYNKDFDQHYSIGKLLGHGQFGYTYVATHKSNGDLVAVKKIDKSKVLISFLSF